MSTAFLQTGPIVETASINGSSRHDNMVSLSVFLSISHVLLHRRIHICRRGGCGHWGGQGVGVLWLDDLPGRREHREKVSRTSIKGGSNVGSSEAPRRIRPGEVIARTPEFSRFKFKDLNRYGGTGKPEGALRYSSEIRGLSTAQENPQNTTWSDAGALLSICMCFYSCTLKPVTPPLTVTYSAPVDTLSILHVPVRRCVGVP